MEPGDTQTDTRDGLVEARAEVPTEADTVQEPAPPLGSWERMYLLVLGFLAFLVVLFTWFTKAFE